MSEGEPGDLGAAFRSCDDLSFFCPVEATVLGYAPNLGASIFFTIAFGILCLATIVIGLRGKTWTFSAAVGLGCILETMGASLFHLPISPNHPLDRLMFPYEARRS